MRRLFFLPLPAIIMLAAVSVSAEPDTRLALVGGMLLDGYGGAPVHHAAILFENNRIVAVGPASEIVIPPGTPVIDTRGETMIPGMIEAHAHLVIVGHGDYERPSASRQSNQIFCFASASCPSIRAVNRRWTSLSTTD